MKLRTTVVLATVLGFIIAATPVAARGDGNTGVAPPQTKPYGSSYAQWSAAWWRFMFAFPIHNPPYTGAIDNPLFDETGSQCAAGQSGSVWYLAGVFNATGTVTRTCPTPIPSGRALFFPVVNSFNSDTTMPGSSCGANVTVDELRDAMEPGIAAATNLHVSVDGVALPDPSRHRSKSTVFAFQLPLADNVFQSIGCNVSGRQGPAVSDGYWMMLRPLPDGPHTIEFGGTLPLSNFTTDVTYHLVVGDDRRSQSTMRLLSL